MNLKETRSDNTRGLIYYFTCLYSLLDFATIFDFADITI